MGWGPFQFQFAPEAASKHAVENYDPLFYTITLLSVIFTALVYVLIVVVALRYKAGSKADRRNPVSHNNVLEATLLGVPTILALLVFGWSARNFVSVRTMPKDAMEVFVIGKQWMWHFQHMNGVRENNELTVPVGKPIKLTMISQDVIHALYLPEMRAQYHVVPGRYTQLQFTPIKAGKYKILCAMHCGTQHSEMVGVLHVLEPRQYAEWLEAEGNRFRPVARTMEDAGALLWKEQGCGNCHGGKDTMRAPTLAGIAGKTRNFTDGTSGIADEDYLRESILNPYRKITKGYTNTMQSYSGQLSEEQVLELIAYIKSGRAGAGQTEVAPIPGGARQGADPANTTDIANQGASAGNAQFRRLENRR